MASWLDKISKAAERVVSVATDATNNTIEKYKKDGFDGFVKNTQETLNKGVESTQQYFKDVGKSTKEVMDEAEQNVGKGTFSGKVASGLAATIHTTQTLADDIVQVSRQFYSNVVKEDSPQENTTKDIKVPVKSKETLYDQVSLEKIMTEVISAKKTDNDNEWIDPKGNTLFLLNNSWYSKNSRQGGKGAISLVAFHLAQLSNLNYSVDNEKLRVKAIQLFSSFEDKLLATPETNVSNVKAQKIQPSEDITPSEKPRSRVATKRASKTVAKNEQKTDNQNTSNEGVTVKAKKSATPRKVARKKVSEPISQVESDAVEAYQKPKSRRKP